MARAEHGAVARDGKMWIFGGITEEHGLMHDLWAFAPPPLITWTAYDFVKGPLPSRRAGHAMTADPASSVFYVFGGRSSIGGVVRGMSDMWMFNVTSSAWTHVSARSGHGPAGRQAAAITFMSGYIFIYGGYDPASNVTFADLWAFHTVFKTWQLLLSSSGVETGGEGRYPPPLHSAFLIPLPANASAPFRPAAGGNSTSPSASRHDALLLYGGLGAGGACAAGTDPSFDTIKAAAQTCDPLITDIGQVYKVQVRCMVDIGVLIM
jgi:hypothetical protein